MTEVPVAGVSRDMGKASVPPPAQPRDELAELLLLTADGCAVSFKALYLRTSKRLLGTILRINQDRAEAEELLQETFIKVWYQCRKFDPARGQGTHWLTSIARNGAIDSLKRKQALPRRALPLATEDVDPFDAMPSAEAGPAEILMQQQQASFVRSWLGTLPAQQRQSLTLAFYDGLSHQEVSRHMGRPLGTVKTWVRCSLLSLKQSMAVSR